MADGGDFSRSIETRSMKRQKTSKDKLDVPKPYSSKLQQLVADVDRVNNELDESNVGERSRNVQMLKTKKVRLLKEIDRLRKEMNGHLDHLERKVKTELDEEIAKLEQEEHGDATTVTDLLTTTNARNTEPECNTDDKRIFIPEKLYQNDVSAANAFLSNANPPNEDVLTFERNTHLYNCVMGADHLGRIVRMSSTPRIGKHCKYVVKSFSERNVSVGDKSPCYISSMCQLQDGTILIADRNNNKLKRLDDQLNVRDYCKLGSAPRGLCCISPTEVAVRLIETIKFLHVGVSLSPGKTIKINRLTAGYGNTIVLFDDNLWTFDNVSILVYSPSGKLLKTIDKDSQGQKLFSLCYPQSIVLHNDGSKAYVTAWNRVVVFNKDGDVIQEMRDQRLDGACGLCITEDEVILVAGKNSKNVFLFDSAGRSVGELVTSKDVLSNPWALCFDRMKCRVLVGY